MSKTIGIFVGSLRRNSFSKSVAEFVVSKSNSEIKFEIIDISKLDIYNQDFDDDNNAPESYTVFRDKVKELSGFLFITPEHNRTIPAVLKNALDVGSRPYGKNVWDAKPGGIVSVSPGQIGAFGANQHLRQPMVFLNVLMMQQPEAYLGDIASALDESGKLVAERTVKFVDNYIVSFTKWVNLITSK